MFQRIIGILSHWLPLAAAVTGICLLIYFGVQQNYRQSLNDPQIQMAEDGVNALLAGKQPMEVVGHEEPFDASKSLKPFIAIYDESGNPLGSSAFIGDTPPRPPMGVFESAKQMGEDRVTWQPGADTRIALVVRPVAIESGWFVAAGRNMREVEAREEALTEGLGFGLLAILGATLILEILGDILRKRL